MRWSRTPIRNSRSGANWGIEVMPHLAFPLGKSNHRCTRLIKLNRPTFVRTILADCATIINVIAVPPGLIPVGDERGPIIVTSNIGFEHWPRSIRW